MDSSSFTLPAPYGCLIDRQRPLPFHFDGRSMAGYAGDTIASALARCGVRVISRSFKYHRPRGILSLNGLDANLLVSVDGEGNVDAGTTALKSGMRIVGQNYLGSLTHDLKAVFGHLNRFLPAGFYYRHFYRPTGAWPRLWEPFFRRQAGLGTIDIGQRRRNFRNGHAFYDVVVVGAGPSGMMASLDAAQHHERVLLLDRNPAIGGALNYVFAAGTHGPDRATCADLRRRIEAQQNIDVWTQALCTGWFAEHWLAVIRGDTLIRVRAGKTVFALGSQERLPVFRNNDLPGVMLGSTVQRLIELYGVKPGHRAVVALADERGHGVIAALTQAGVSIAAVLDARDVVAAIPGPGNRSVRGVRYVHGSEQLEFPCDLLVVCGRQEPADQLYRQALHTLGPRSDNPPSCVGALSGVHSLADILSGVTSGSTSPSDASADPIEAAGFIDLDEDVTVDDLRTALASGYGEIELAKRFTTVGMGPSQGRHSAKAAARWLATHTDRSKEAIGVTTARPPIYPEKLGVLAGAHLSMDKLSPLHRRNLAAGAQMTLAGGWLRPDYYERDRGRDAAIEAEIACVRQRVGLLDVSPLGKIELRGRDAGEFLDRLYTMSYGSLPVGKTRYLLMTNEAGYIVDDGVSYRIDDTFFYATATSSSVERTFRSMLRWRALWKLDVSVVNVTNAFAAVNLAGPRARDVLNELATTIDLSPAGFPYLGGRSGLIEGIPVRIMRIGFVGELGYEIHFPAEHAEYLWDLMLNAGHEEGLQPVGLQALRALRLEKAHIIVGQDTDPLTWPDEVGMQWALSRKKPFFVGKPSIEIMRTRAPSRRLVGFVLPQDGPLPLESELIVDRDRPIGYITSVARSSTCSSIVGLAFVEGSEHAAGSELQILSADRILRAKVFDGAFYDPENKRQER